MNKRYSAVILLMLLALMLSGCGYTTSCRPPTRR